MIIFSISGSPGTFGTKMYNHLFKRYGLDVYYQTLRVTSDFHLMHVLDLFECSDEIRGMSISMPYKAKIATHYPLRKACGDLEIFSEINSLNTLVKYVDGIAGYSTDLAFFSEFRKLLPLKFPILIYGTGSMASTAEYYYTYHNHPVLKLPRNSTVGDDDLIHASDSVAFINATPAKIEELIPKTSSIPYLLDLPVRHDWTFDHKRSGWIDGITCAKLQFKYQFLAYTGLHIDISEINSAYQAIFD